MRLKNREPQYNKRNNDKTTFNFGRLSAAEVKKEMPVLLRSLKSSILSSTSSQMDDIFWGEVSAAVEHSRRKVNMVAQGDGKFGPGGWPQIPSKPFSIIS